MPNQGTELLPFSVVYSVRLFVEQHINKIYESRPRRELENLNPQHLFDLMEAHLYQNIPQYSSDTQVRLRALERSMLRSQGYIVDLIRQQVEEFLMAN